MIKNTPTIEEINDLFIPKKFREYFEITKITPDEIFLKAKKIGTPDTTAFFKVFLQINRMIGIKIRLQE